MHHRVIASVGNVALIVLVAIISVGAVIARIKLSINLTRRRNERGRPEERAAAVLKLWWLWLPLGLIVAAFGLTQGTGLLDPTSPFTLGLVLLVWGVGGAYGAFRRRS